MSAGVGMADFWPVAAAAPTSLAYSGSTVAAPPPDGRAATCQISTMAAKISSDSAAARRPSEAFIACPHPEEPCVAWRLEGWATPRLFPTLRDAALRAAPQGEDVVAPSSRSHGGAHQLRLMAKLST